MSERTCGIIARRFESMMTANYSGRREDDYLPECILSACHLSDAHVFLTPNGIYVAWQDDDDCCCCASDEEDRCTIYREIAKRDLEEIINGGNIE